MTDLFGDDTLFLQREGSNYVIEGDSGLVARLDERPLETKQGFRHVLRSLANRQATPHAVLRISDADGAHRFDLEAAPGDRTNAHLTVSRPGGDPVGSVVASGGMFTVFPVFVLRDPTGAPLGRLTTRGAPCAYDVAEREMARVTFGSTRPVMGKLVCEVEFVGPVPELSRVLVVAALIGWERSR
ncbi:hypothetical protein [Nocardioides nanhaiensis]|uniref:Scramblase n=1 Tax=Nocardioides nanhaiensis TaxID=1476871 RepID=A0ABP8X0H1_9ACTN